MIKITFRIWIWIFFMIIAVMAINPLMALEKGVLVKSVEKNSTAELSGFTAGEIIKEIDGTKIYSVQEYSQKMNSISVNPVQFSVLTDKGTFAYTSKSFDFSVNEILNNQTNKTSLLIADAEKNASISGLKQGMIVSEINGNKVSTTKEFEQTRNKLEPRINSIIKTNKKEYALSLNKPLEVVIGEIPSTNIKAGLDLQGGARGLVKPVEKVSSAEIDDLILVSKERLNVYGISDMNIRHVTDMSGNNYMLVEVAGATPQELSELIGKQGKFEAKIGNNTVFIGGKNDIPSVCRNDAQCSRIERCYQVEGGYGCEFIFSIYLSEEAAQKQADATKWLLVNKTQSGEEYLNETLDLYLDDKSVSSLMISKDLKGKPETQIAISGPGFGPTQADAYKSAEKEMLKLQTILITGSLPFKLEIVKLDSVSPVLGKEFTKNIFTASAAALLVVLLIITIRYRRLSNILPIAVVIISELILTLGMAALIKWNLDLASIAGIIAAIGTGVDDQIVILDESRTSSEYNWKERIKRAFSIIFGAFSTVVAAMLPLWWAGAGLLKGFAVTTLLGICIGVLITRPAFADIISQISKE